MRKPKSYNSNGDRHWKHHHFRVAIIYGDSGSLSKVFTNAERAQRFTIRLPELTD